MLIHLKPSIYDGNPIGPCSLVDLTCHEFGLKLVGGKDLIARRPYPNKNWLVACRKVGRKALNGLFIETQVFVREFNVVTRWAVAASHIATHRVRYILADDGFDTSTVEMTLWGEFPPSFGGYKSRHPIGVNYGSPMESEPRMDVFNDRKRVGDIADKIDQYGFLIERSEVFRMPTLERERFSISLFSDRMPAIESAFQSQVKQDV